MNKYLSKKVKKDLASLITRLEVSRMMMESPASKEKFESWALWNKEFVETVNLLAEKYDIRLPGYRARVA